MRALFIQQDHTSPTGPIGEQFVNRGFDVDEFLVVPELIFPSPHVDVVFPDPLDYDVIVPMGAIWGVYQQDEVAWIRDELELLRTAHENDVALFGICFGGQSVAAALGGTVYIAEQSEIGWYEVQSDRPELIEPGPWFEWHQDRWTPPPGANTIARTDAADQAFVVGRALALQFHPELTPSALTGWLDNGGSKYLTEHGFDVDRLIEQTETTKVQAAERARNLVDRFLDHVAFPAGVNH